MARNALILRSFLWSQDASGNRQATEPSVVLAVLSRIDRGKVPER